MAEDIYTIRSARFDELERLRQIERAAASRFAEIGLEKVAESEPVGLEMLRSQQRIGQVWVAADADDQPVGFIVTFEIEGALHIEEISVHPDHGGRGLGKRLIETLAHWAKQQSYPAITLSTFRDVLWNAPFYGRIGFRVFEEAEMSAAIRDWFREETLAWSPLVRVWMCREL